MTDIDDTDEVLGAVSTAVLAVTRHLSVAEVLEVIVRSARRLLGARYAALGIPDDEGGFAEFIADGVSDRQRERIGPLPRQHGMLAALLRGGETIRVPDIQADPRFGWWPKAHPVMSGFLGVPIVDGDDVVGIVFLANKISGSEFDERDERILTLFAAHAAIALANARLYERSLELSVVEERNRLARELHDVVAQQLFSLRLTARSAAALLETRPAEAARLLERVEELSGTAIDELRSVIVELRPAELDSSGLVDTVRKFVELAGRTHGVTTEFSAEGELLLSRAGEVEVLRMVQEAVHNALRHARADLVTVALRGGESIVMTVGDNGEGFDPQSGTPRGLGLLSMTERTERLGGRIDIDARPGEGTTVTVTIPCEQPTARQASIEGES
ncbi:histidine kinase/DNA gyrase B/HSP90-like ATPase [Stackebrandtia endophytica]|uniref:Oxygen sensor histidine kinase NreB n=1 Tax=Stackebrandtia endophytica TaxID=1496996 RepID=A0A543B4E0_9ACTN|nr:GAF domain-containing sensor histidine kinase [Stackebrandtia endophytica]TQL79691.1 histidine kinase/DNA gyrase B/HSP90-like ATPase [Stackebrandtia endophytica]